MMLDRLIEQLQRIRLECPVEDAGRLPVILCTGVGSGELYCVEVMTHPETGKPEVWLEEKM